MTRGDTMDLSGSLEKALHAARHGDLDGLELELVRLRAMPTESVGSIGTRLRAMARSVRAHPSFSDIAHAQAV
jgi:hypothetical protein